MNVTHFEIGPVRIALVVLLLITLAGCASTGGGPTGQLVSEVPSAQASLDAGDEAARAGDLQRALAHYMRAVSMEDSVDGWLRLGAASERLRNNERALYAYLQVIELEPEHIDAHQGAGLAYLALGEDANAAPHLARVVAQDPQRWRSHNALGILADRAGNHETAIDHYSAALQTNPDSPTLLNNLGYSRYLAGDLDEAARTFDLATQQYPEYGPAWSNLGMVQARHGWYQQAIETFGRVVDGPTAHNDVAYIAFQRGDLATAERLFREAVRLSPTYFPAANQNLERVRANMRNGGDQSPGSGPFPAMESDDAYAAIEEARR